MTGVLRRAVAADEAGIRLDRWFKRHFPALAHGRLEKLLRTGQVRVDGGRAKAGQRLAPGQEIRVPPLPTDAPPGISPRAPARPAPAPVPRADTEALRDAVIYRDDDIIVIDKPAGLAVQGGSGIHRHLDAMLDALRLGARERPRLVHRLDKDTSGVLVLARNAVTAAALAAAFRRREVGKTYWAVVVGVPKPRRGEIDLALAKRGGGGGERVAAADGESARRAVTRYRVVEAAATKAAWLELSPETGRTHQLRAHCMALGTPILGDGKYGGRAAFLAGLAQARRLHLHARAIALPRQDGSVLTLTARLPAHMAASFEFFGFDPSAAD